MLAAAAGRRPKVSVFGDDYDTPDGTAVRDYIHIEDLGEAHLLALAHLRRGGASHFLNLGNGTGYSVLEVIETARRVTGLDVPYEKSPRREGDPPRLVGNATKAHAVLGWAPRRPSLEAIVRSAWEWMQAHPDGYGRVARVIPRSLAWPGDEESAVSAPADPSGPGGTGVPRDDNAPRQRGEDPRHAEERVEGEGRTHAGHEPGGLPGPHRLAAHEEGQHEARDAHAQHLAHEPHGGEGRGRDAVGALLDARHDRVRVRRGEEAEPGPEQEEAGDQEGEGRRGSRRAPAGRGPPR